MISSSVSYTAGGETLNKLNKTLERREVFNLNSTHALLATDAFFFFPEKPQAFTNEMQKWCLPGTYKCFLSV